MLAAYPACFFKEKKGYSVIFPDLNYLATCGNSMNEALCAAVDCLAGYLYCCKKEGETILEASSFENVNVCQVAEELGLKTEGAFVNIVTVDVEEYAKLHFEKAVKKTLTIPAWLNDMALKNNINFSQVLQDALKEKLRVR